MAMFGNGARTGTVTTQPVRLPILQDLLRARTACPAAVVGTTTPGTAVQPFAAGTSLAAVTTAWDSGLLFPQVSEPGAESKAAAPQGRCGAGRKAAQAPRWSAERSRYF